MDKERPDEYRVRDINVAAFLEMNKALLLRTEKDQGILIFIFAGFKKCNEIVGDYYEGRAVGNLKEFVFCQKKIKRLIADSRVDDRQPMPR